ncbi:hypothetical protein ASPWEDRAFT_37097 [Aspergillus wentii DTO 134E9]|uniref:F-box domain-containing protein n=1 Tax=Aspergillus wentii DTO 134E9 TaxID=1073089 RepID=A0A1L9RWN4_ASPWE|nr:uncharacterized protein ASPWEDRAFT_37097 [Aspergillus wentii DTO 134E9]KAI9928978.1 hypothetical protein MW887_001371 [Aspergillus wentii]OJJ39336.1 hypothetical protein ASPWEDRAFT_37097 [Aspergillus wentii DTO 134E9]
MSLQQQSTLELLPNELLDHIISYLSSNHPSSGQLHQPPSFRIVKSHTRYLKNLSRVSSRLLELVRPQLFSHACFNVEDENKFLSFITQLDLARYVTSLVVKGSDYSPDSREEPFWWRRVLCHLDPLHITVIAPPLFIGAALGTEFMSGHSWAFEIPLQTLYLEQERRHNHMQSPQLESQSSILSTRTWKSMLFNEASSLRAYNHYEYFLFQVPSVFNKWGSLASIQTHPENLPQSLSLTSLTTFCYTAVFPFYNHVKLVLDTLSLMTSLQSFSVQLAPCQNDRVIEAEQRGSMDPSDPWMELATAYSLIAHSVRDLGQKGSLRKFQAYDYLFDPLRPELSSILGDVLNANEWAHDGSGTWTRKLRQGLGLHSE